MILFGLLTAVIEGSAGDAVAVGGGLFAAILTALTSIQTAQLSGLRSALDRAAHDFETYRSGQDERMDAVEDRLSQLEGSGERRVSRTRPTGSHSTTRGRTAATKKPKA